MDCSYTDPPSEEVEANLDEACVFVCPEDLALGYQTPGCCPTFVECLAIPPPCADEYCSGESVLIYGCGVVSEAFLHAGPCD